MPVMQQNNVETTALSSSGEIYVSYVLELDYALFSDVRKKS